MDRLTERTPQGDVYYPKCFAKCKGSPDLNDCIKCTLNDELAEKLAAYEDKDEWEEECKAIFRRALDTYGAEHQIRKLFEEKAELQEALCKFIDGRDTLEHLAEEIGDVQNVLEQMILLYDCADEVAASKRAKVERLEEQLEGCCAHD